MQKLFKGGKHIFFRFDNDPTIISEVFNIELVDILDKIADENQLITKI